VHGGAWGAEVDQFLHDSCGPFFLYSLEGVGGRLAEKCFVFFLSLGHCCAGSPMGFLAPFMD